MRAVLVHVERDDDVPLHRHRRVRDEPVALDLRDEAPDPRTELDALGVELNRRPERARSPCEFSKLIASGRSAAGSAAPRRACRRPAPRPSARASGGCGGGDAAGVGIRQRQLRLGDWRSRRGSGCRLLAGGAGSGAGPWPRAACSSRALDALGRVAARERQRIGRLRRALGCCAPGDPGPRARRAAAAAGAWTIDARLDEDEARRLAAGGCRLLRGARALRLRSTGNNSRRRQRCTMHVRAGGR